MASSVDVNQYIERDCKFRQKQNLWSVHRKRLQVVAVRIMELGNQRNKLATQSCLTTVPATHYQQKVLACTCTARNNKIIIHQGRSCSFPPGSADPDEICKIQCKSLFILVNSAWWPHRLVDKTPLSLGPGFAPTCHCPSESLRTITGLMNMSFHLVTSANSYCRMKQACQLHHSDS